MQLDDAAIVDLYWDRSENAVMETANKYGAMLMSISRSLTPTNEDAEECVSDTYHAAWCSMPDDRPTYLGAYLAKIVRRLSIDRFRACHAAKRCTVSVVLDEVSEIFESGSNIDTALSSGEIRRVLDSFLRSLNPEKRAMFVRRYFYSESIADIAKKLDVSPGKVKTALCRLRVELGNLLGKEGLL